jgi:hypothetical protein
MSSAFGWMAGRLPMKDRRALFYEWRSILRSFIMSHKGVVVILASGALALFSLVIVAQQQNNPSQEKVGPMGRGMMSGGMMMNQMMAQHQDMSQLMSKMMQSMTAINNEKDPGKLKALLAEHAALMNQMRSKMTGQGNMMQNVMSQMRNCPGMSDAAKSASK